MHENYEDVVRQIEAMGCELRNGKDLPLKVDMPRKQTCGKKGKHWYRLYTFAPDNSARRFIVGSFGSYRDGVSFKVEWDREGLSAEALERYKKQRAEARELERQQAEEDAREAALSAAQLWAQGEREGHSPYIERKQVDPEACRFMADGSILVPLLRYDLPREERLRAVQRIYPGPRKHRRTGEDLPQKTFTTGFAKSGCCLRLGEIDGQTPLLMVGEGYATCLSIRMATARRWPVFMALDAYNLAPVVPLLRSLYPAAFILVCADDDWQTKDHDGANPGRNKAHKVAKSTERCELVWPVFNPAGRGHKDTDFNDLHVREGLAAVQRQLVDVIQHILEREGV